MKTATTIITVMIGLLGVFVSALASVEPPAPPTGGELSWVSRGAEINYSAQEGKVVCQVSAHLVEWGTDTLHGAAGLDGCATVWGLGSQSVTYRELCYLTIDKVWFYTCAANPTTIYIPMLVKYDP